MIPFRRRFSKQGREGGSVFSVLMGIALLGVIGYLAFSDWKIYRTRAELERKVEVLQAEIKKLELRNAELEKLLAKAGTEEYAEKIARERLNLKKPGEGVVMVIPPEPQTDLMGGDEGIQKPVWWRKILQQISSLFSRD